MSLRYGLPLTFSQERNLLRDAFANDHITARELGDLEKHLESAYRSNPCMLYYWIGGKSIPYMSALDR